MTTSRSTRRALIRAIPALAGLALVAGCTATPTPPASTSTVPAAVSASASVTPSVTSAVGPATVDAPTSSSAAIEAANQSVLGYLQVAFDSAHQGGAALATVTPWVSGDALTNERLLAAYLQKQHYRLDGTAQPWTLSTSKSTAGIETTTGDQTIPYGAVQLVGCIQSTNHPVGTGAPAWTTKNRWFRTPWTVTYLPTRRQWVVAKRTILSGTNGMATCTT
jgi:hypothetical protein